MKYICRCAQLIGMNKMTSQALQLILKQINANDFPIKDNNLKIFCKYNLVCYLEQEYQINF